MIATLRITRLQASGSRAQTPDARSLKPEACRLKPGACRRRRGISLLEVLIAVFVLTFGLMGIAMVIPAGRALMIEAAKSDRGSACGRAILGDIQVRDWHNPQLWKQKWGSLGTGYRSAILNANEYSDLSANDYLMYNTNSARDDSVTGLIYGESFFLDPYFIAYGLGTPDANAGKDSIGHFPYSRYPFRELCFTGTADDRKWPERALARRVGPQMVNLPGGVFLTESLAERITTWADDLVFHLASEDASRPRQNYVWSDGQVWTAPPLPSEVTTPTASEAPLRADAEARFTWTVMLTPIMPRRYHGSWDHDNNNASPRIPMVRPDSISQYEISIIVFYNRYHYCPEHDAIRAATDIEEVRERSVYAQIVGGGLAGGDVKLFVADTDADGMDRPVGYLNVKKDQWVMLKGLDLAGEMSSRTGFSGIMPTLPTVCKWYRVVDADDVHTTTIPDPTNLSGTIDGRGRYVTLAGPDWQVDTVEDLTDPIKFNAITDIAEAAIVDDVVGVYTTIIDVNSL
jgi:pilin/secretion family protein with methylation motif